VVKQRPTSRNAPLNARGALAECGGFPAKPKAEERIISDTGLASRGILREFTLRQEGLGALFYCEES
jgi:hypothetical protein